MADIDHSQYDIEAENNNMLAQKLLERLFPDIAVPYEVLGEIIGYLSETGVNVQVLPRVVRGIHNLTIGTGDGEVIVHVRKNTLTVETKERDGEIKTKNI